MEVYLNVIEMGDGIYGVQAASQAYFHKDASGLTKQQAAALASISFSSTRLNGRQPIQSDYVRLVHRQYLILKNMRRLGAAGFF